MRNYSVWKRWIIRKASNLFKDMQQKAAILVIAGSVTSMNKLISNTPPRETLNKFSVTLSVHNIDHLCSARVHESDGSSFVMDSSYLDIFYL